MSKPDILELRYLNTRHKAAALKGEAVGGSPRLGRRESEPHSHKINYLFDVLSTNFPDSRTFWDLHHYFDLDGDLIDLQFDISYFKDFKFGDQISSFRSSDFDGLRPTMVINILSSSTYNTDLGLTAQTCQELGIPVYVVFSDHLFAPKAVKAPFLKIIYEDGGKYKMAELHDVSSGLAPDKLIDIRPDLLPFKFGICELEVKYWKNGKRYPLYQLILIDRETGSVLKTKAEIAEEKARKAEEKVKEAEEKARKAEEKVKEAEEKARKAEEKVKEAVEEAERERLIRQELERELERLRDN